MATNKRIIYHWTHLSNLDSIAKTGLDPSYATGELHAVWGCDRERVDWALDHCSGRHKKNPEQFVLLRVEVHSFRVYRTCWRGVWYTPCHVPPASIALYSPDGNHRPLTDRVPESQSA